MNNSPQDIYAQFLPKHRGYPLWIPQLCNTHDLPREYQQDGIQIGDVGVVDTDSGFNVLFNVRKPGDHPLHTRWQSKGFPAFDPVCLNRQDITVKSDAIQFDTVISSGVTRIDPPRRPSAEYEFAPSSTEGAILILPEGAVFHDLIPKNLFRDLAVQHAPDWYHFAVRCLQRPIGNHSLYLVTGFFKARSWSLAAFKGASLGDDSQQVWLTKAERGNNTRNYKWGHAFHVEWNDGPRRDPNQNADQCVFLRGFKIALKDEIFGLVTQCVTDLVAGEELRMVINCYCFSFRRWRFKRKTQGTVSSQNPSIDPTHEPKLSQPFHPSDTMNRFLLGKDAAMTVAVTHDSEWIDFLDQERLSSDQLMQEGYFAWFLSEKCSFDPQHGVVYVEVEGEGACDASNFIHYASECSTTGGSEYKSLSVPVAVAAAGISRVEQRHDNSRTVNVITSIRGDQLTGVGCAPIECHVLVQSGDRKRRTKDRPVMAGEVTVWDDLILLPPELSAILRISICSYSGSTSEVEELHTGEVTVEKLLTEEFVEFPGKGEGSDGTIRPSLLINTSPKNLDVLDDSNFRSREQSFRLAKVAEQDKRWEDVVNHMNDIARLDRELTTEERDLFSSGYACLIATNRASCDTQGLEGKIIRICEEVLDILDRHLIPSTMSTESVVFYGRMVGDYHRCASDFYVDSQRKWSIEKSLAAYEGASGIARSGLFATHPIRLQLALNFSLLYYEVLHNIDQAIRVAEKVLEDALDAPEGFSENCDLMPVLQSLRDNVACWKREEKERFKKGQGEGEDSDDIGDIKKKADEVPNVQHNRAQIEARQPPGKRSQTARDVWAPNVDHFLPAAEDKLPCNEVALDTHAAAEEVAGGAEIGPFAPYDNKDEDSIQHRPSSLLEHVNAATRSTDLGGQSPSAHVAAEKDEDDSIQHQPSSLLNRINAAMRRVILGVQSPFTRVTAEDDDDSTQHRPSSLLEHINAATRTTILGGQSPFTHVAAEKEGGAEGDPLGPDGSNYLRAATPPDAVIGSMVAEEESGSRPARARYSFDGSGSGELPLTAGMEIEVFDDRDSAWWYARNPQTGREGVVPASYLY